MICPQCKKNDLLVHVSLEPSVNLGRRANDSAGDTEPKRRRGDLFESTLPKIIDIQCRTGCQYPVGGNLFKIVETIYWAAATHQGRLDIIRAKAARENEIENRAYLDNVKLLQGMLEEALRRERAGVFPINPP
jgi:hypothetical protein